MEKLLREKVKDDEIDRWDQIEEISRVQEAIKKNAYPRGQINMLKIFVWIFFIINIT